MVKKIILLIFLLIIMPKEINASSTYIDSKSAINPGETFNVTIGINSSENIYGIIGTLNYDTKKLKLEKHQANNNFSITLGNKIVADNTTSLSGRFSFIVLTFKATTEFKSGEDTTISYSSVTASDGAKNLSLSSSSKKITVLTLKSTNNNLSEITVNSNKINNFSPTTTNYNIVVENSTVSVTLEAKKADNKSLISGLGKKDLKIYNNEFQIIVTAENGTKKSYYVNVIRKDKENRTKPLSSNALLKELIITNLDKKTIEVKENMTLTVPFELEELNLLAAPVESTSTIEILNKSLVIGNNNIEIIVTAEDQTKKRYYLQVERLKDALYIDIKDIMNIETEKKEVVISFEDRIIIDNELKEKLKSLDKILYFKSTNYSLEIETKNLENTLNFELLEKNISNKEIDEITKNSRYLMLKFNENESLPKNTKFVINVSEYYQDGEILNFYYYDNNKLENKSEGLIVGNGEVTLSLEHTSTYILTKANLHHQQLDLLKIIYPIILVIQGIFISFLIYKK